MIYVITGVSLIFGSLAFILMKSRIYDSMIYILIVPNNHQNLTKSI